MPRDVTQRLGRGLASLIGEAAPEDSVGTVTTEIRRIRTGDVEPGPFQPRGSVDPERLRELVDSIRSHGILQPILLRPHPRHRDRYEIVAGERRWRAAVEAGLADIPALVRTLSDSDAMAAALVENLQREDLNVLEEAAGYARLIAEFSMTQERLATAVGKSRSHIANIIRLLHLPAPVQDALRSGAITAGHARALLTHPDPERALHAVVRDGLNVRQTEAMHAGQLLGDRPEIEPAPRKSDKALDTLALERDLSARLGLKVLIQSDGQRGTLRIAYKTLDQLEALISLLSP